MFAASNVFIIDVVYCLVCNSEVVIERRVVSPQMYPLSPLHLGESNS